MGNYLIVTLLVLFSCSVLITCSSTSQNEFESNEKVLRIGGFIPGVERSDHFGYLTALEMALDWLNKNHILPDNYTVQLDIEDTNGIPAYAIYALGKFFQQPPKVAFVGPAFSKALKPVAQALQLFTVLQVSVGSTASFFNNLLEYPFLFRTVPTTELYNFARVAFVNKFGWKRFGLIYDRNDESLALTSSLLLKALVKNGCNVVSSVGVGNRDDNYVEVLERFKALNIRVIFGDFLSVVARKVFCAAYKTGFYGKKYIWIISGNIRERLKIEDFLVSCKVEDIVTASNLVFTIGQLNYVLGNETTITGETGPQLYRRYQQTANALGRKHRTYGGYAFDAIIAIGLVIKKTFQRIDWVHMSYDNYTAVNIAKSTFRKLRFQGMTGLVHFNEHSERKVDIAIQQVVDGKEELFAIFDNESQTINFVEGKASFAWHGDASPLDGEKRVQKRKDVSIGLPTSLIMISSIGIIACVVILTMMLKFRSIDAIRKCSPRLTLVLLFGCFLCYLTVFLLATETLNSQQQQQAAISCKARQWVMVIAFTLSFGAMFAKTFRVYRIMTNKALQKELAMISDTHLFIMLSCFLLIDIIYLSLWESLDPLNKKFFWLPPQIVPEQDLKIETYMLLCDCEHFVWWLMGMFIYKGCLLVFGLFLAYETRNIYYVLNDSRNISFTVYNVGVFSVLGAVISMVLKKNQQEIIDGFIGCCIVFCTTVTISIIFFPKMIAIYRGDKDDSNENGELQPKIEAPKLLMPIKLSR